MWLVQQQAYAHTSEFSKFKVMIHAQKVSGCLNLKAEKVYWATNLTEPLDSAFNKQHEDWKLLI